MSQRKPSKKGPKDVVPRPSDAPGEYVVRGLARPRVRRMEVVEDEEKMVLVMEAPDVDREDLRVDVSEFGVIVRGEPKRGPVFTVPVEFDVSVDQENASARLNNGVVEVCIPKMVRDGQRSVRVVRGEGE